MKIGESLNSSSAEMKPMQILFVIGAEDDAEWKREKQNYEGSRIWEWRMKSSQKEDELKR